MRWSSAIRGGGGIIKMNNKRYKDETKTDEVDVSWCIITNTIHFLIGCDLTSIISSLSHHISNVYGICSFIVYLRHLYVPSIRQSVTPSFIAVHGSLSRYQTIHSHRAGTVGICTVFQLHAGGTMNALRGACVTVIHIRRVGYIMIGDTSRNNYPHVCFKAVSLDHGAAIHWTTH